MANRFTNSYQNNQGPFYGNQQNNQNIFSQWNEFRQNPAQFLSNHGINIPPEYTGSFDSMGQYVMGQMNQKAQNEAIQKANWFASMFNFR